eukprot:766518-Hanusia_phi.AAC.3
MLVPHPHPPPSLLSSSLSLLSSPFSLLSCALTVSDLFGCLLGVGSLVHQLAPVARVRRFEDSPSSPPSTPPPHTRTPCPLPPAFEELDPTLPQLLCSRGQPNTTSSLVDQSGARRTLTAGERQASRLLRWRLEQTRASGKLNLIPPRRAPRLPATRG